MKLERVSIAVSDHAVTRYRERIGPVSGKQELVSLVRGATKCPDWLAFQMFTPSLRDKTLTRKETKRKMRGVGMANKYPNAKFLIDRDTGAVFLLEPGDVDDRTLVVVTVVDSRPRLEAIRLMQDS